MRAITIYNSTVLMMDKGWLSRMTLRRMRVSVIIWTVVLSLPKMEAEMVMPFLAESIRIPSTAKSRTRMRANIQSGMRSW